MMDPTTEIVGVIVAVATSLGSAGFVLFQGGRQVGIVEAAIRRFSKMEADLEVVRNHETKIEVIDTVQKNLKSNIDELRYQVGSIRGRERSHHDIE